MSQFKYLPVTVLLSIFSASASAAVVYGDDVKFTYDDSTLYGSAFTVGNSIIFQPTNFRAESTNGSPATVTTSETLNITVEVITAGYEITDFALAESGDYFLDGAGTEVKAGGRLQVSSGTKLCGYLQQCIASETFDATGLTVQNLTTDWSVGTSIDLATVANWGADTEVMAQIQNNLSATSLDVGEQAWIQKKSQFVGLEVTIVPLPAAVWMFLSALGLTGLFRSRRRA